MERLSKIKANNSTDLKCHIIWGPICCIDRAYPSKVGKCFCDKVLIDMKPNWNKR